MNRKIIITCLFIASCLAASAQSSPPLLPSHSASATPSPAPTLAPPHSASPTPSHSTPAPSHSAPAPALAPSAPPLLPRHLVPATPSPAPSHSAPSAPPPAPPSSAAEKLYVHTDKEFYLAGEILWFKLYVIDAATHQPADLSKIAYVEIISNDQHPALQAKIALDEGAGSGSFQLPFSIHSGNYILRAYTRWMMNAGPEAWFEKKLTILNTLRNDDPPPTPAPSTPISASPTPASAPSTPISASPTPASASASSISASPTPASPKYDIQFFPEGGTLVQGLPARVAFRIADHSGKGLSCKGTLIDAAGDTITHFQTLRFGMGELSFTPPTGSCKALLELDDHTQLTASLPSAKNKGYTMQVTAGDDERLTISVHTNITGGDPVIRLLSHNHTSIIAIDQKTMVNGEALFTVDGKSLPEGITLFTLFTASHEPVGERLWFRRPTSLKMDLHTDKANYNPREKVTLKLTTPIALTTSIVPAPAPPIAPAPGIPIAPANPPHLDASLAVVLQDSLQFTGHEDILNYLFLSSDLRGAIESPEYYFYDDSPEVKKTTDLLMMTQGWRRFLPITATHLPEYAGLLVTGKVTDRQTNTPASGIFAWLSAPGQKFRLASAVSNRDGGLQWDLGMLYGAHELVVQTGDSINDRRYRIDLLPPFANPQTQNTPSPASASSATQWAPSQLLRHSIAAQAQNAYQTYSRQHFSQPTTTDTLAFYGRPARSYWLDDYTRFTTMEEVMREYIREVRVRNTRGNFAFYVQADQRNELFFETRPLVLVDGVPVSDINNIIRFDPLKFSKIEIVTKRHLLADSLYSGIISYSTYSGDLSGFPLDPNAYILDYEGLQLHREFYSPIYDTKDQQTSRIPDFRNILYWSPDITTNSSGNAELSFYTSDIPGTYTVIVQGLTTTGQAGSTRTTFTVEKPTRQN